MGAVHQLVVNDLQGQRPFGKETVDVEELRKFSLL